MRQVHLVIWPQRFLMVNHTTGNVTSTGLAFVCGRSIVVTCHIQTLALLMSRLLLFIRICAQTYLVSAQVHSRILCGNAGMQIPIIKRSDMDEVLQHLEGS